MTNVKVSVFLTYLDDSGTNDKKAPFQTMTAVIVPDYLFNSMEMLVSLSVDVLVPPDKIQEFEEFKGAELYYGHGVFSGVDQRERFATIQALLQAVPSCLSYIVYAGVDKNKMDHTVYGSANPLDVCFRLCVEGIDKWMREKFPGELALLISDDSEDKNLKRQLRQSFRDYRKRIWNGDESQPNWNFHDELYFGNSVDSIGIQMADLCGYFVNKHLKKNDVVAESFYQVFADRIVYEKVEPEA